MRKFQRLPAPEFLVLVSEMWGIEWETRLQDNPKATFHWHKVDGKRVNEMLLPKLKVQVQDHCSFCDNYPISPPSQDTIDHFRPKRRFPREAYQWTNLYYCCDFCQGRRDVFDEGLLRPDGEGYEFDHFFRWDFTTGELKVNEQASPGDQQRASATITLYRLNEKHPALRLRALRDRAKRQTDQLNDFAYRSFVAPEP